jgi:uncharacterized protein
MADITLTVLFLAAAILYSSVGHAGASGYLAAMAFVGAAPNIMKPTALVLNLLVATIATLRFSRAGHFSWSLLWPFALGSIPLAFIGGGMTLPGHWYKVIVGIVLIIPTKSDPPFGWMRCFRTHTFSTLFFCTQFPN